MEPTVRRYVRLLIVLCAFALAIPAGAQTRRYVCAPCSLPCDSAFFDKPGICPSCGMALIDQEEALNPSAPRKKAGILVFDGVEVIDFAGPFEVFGAAGFDVYTIAETKNPVTPTDGLTILPKYSFADAPQPDVLVIPGGGVQAARNNGKILQWIRDETAHTVHTMSVCNGAFILGSAGLLKGLTATTTMPLLGKLKSDFPDTRVVYDARFVDNGKVVTTAGLSAGIDGALHMVDLMLGPGIAQEVALSLEYDWHPAHGFVRAALADMLLPELDLKGVGKWTTLETGGGTDHWKKVVHLTSGMSASGVIDTIASALTAVGKWKMMKREALRTDWAFPGRDGAAWGGRLNILEVPGKKGEFTVSVDIARNHAQERRNEP